MNPHRCIHCTLLRCQHENWTCDECLANGAPKSPQQQCVETGHMSGWWGWPLPPIAPPKASALVTHSLHTTDPILPEEFARQIRAMVGLRGAKITFSPWPLKRDP